MRSRLALCFCVGVLLVTAFDSANSAESKLRPIHIDDILAAQSVGRSVITPDGATLIYEWIDSYDKSPNIDALSSADDLSQLSKIYTLSLTAQAAPKPLFPQEENSSYWIGAASPDGGKLAIYILQQETLHAGIYDLDQHRLIRFDFTPNYFRLVQRPVWISSDDVIFATVPAGDTPTGVYRRNLAQRLRSLWDLSFSGTSPSATVLRSTSSGTDYADVFRPGALIRANTTTGTTEKLAEGYFYNLRSTLGARWLAGLKEGGQLQVGTNPQFAGDGASLARKQLVVVDLQSGAEPVLPCALCNVLPGTLHWSGDGRILTFFARLVGEEAKEALPYAYVPATRTLTALDAASFRFACGPMIGTHFTAVGIGRLIAIRGRYAGGEGTFGVDSRRCQRGAEHSWFLFQSDFTDAFPESIASKIDGDPIGLSESNLFVLSGGLVQRVDDTGKAHRILTMPQDTTAWGVGLEIMMRSMEAIYTGRELPSDWSILESPHHITALNLQNFSHKKIYKPTTTSRPIAIAPDAGVAVFRAESRQGSTLQMMDDKGATRTLLTFNRHLERRQSADRAHIRYELPSVGAVSSCMLLPPGWTPTKRYPVIVHVYPNTPGDCISADLPAFNPLNLQLLAASGYIVLFPALPRTAIRGSSGPTQYATQVVLAAVDEAIRAGYADPSKLGLIGISQGYQLAAQIVTESTRFKAAVVINGVSNLTSHYGTIPLANRFDPDTFAIGSPGRYEGLDPDYGLGATLWGDPSLYVQNSPIFSADRISAPILIMHSDFDAFPLSQSEELFSALYRLRKEAEYVTYWGEAHGNLSPSNVRDSWSRIHQWFSKHLH